MLLPLQTFSNLVQNMAATMQASATQLLNVAVGSVLRALLEASASVALWMQWMILQVLQMTRAATSNGPDLDSWMADFSLLRLPAGFASGMVTFSRYTSTATALVPVGALVRTIDGSQTFVVLEQSGISGWNQGLNGYLLSVGVASLAVPVVAQTAGTCGNVQANTITVLATALAGIDAVSNSLAFSNGLDAESDAAFRLRFQSYLSSRSRATMGAVENAIISIQQGLSYTIQENTSPSGTPQLGNFLVVVDDGSGYPSTVLLSAIQAAIEAVRPVGSTFAVFPPVVVQVNVSLTVVTDDSTTTALVIPGIIEAIETYVDLLPVGACLPASRIIQLAYAASPDIVNVTAVLLNNQPGDIAATPLQVIKIGNIVVS